MTGSPLDSPSPEASAHRLMPHPLPSSSPLRHLLRPPAASLCAPSLAWGKIFCPPHMRGLRARQHEAGLQAPSYLTPPSGPSLPSHLRRPHGHHWAPVHHLHFSPILSISLLTENHSHHRNSLYALIYIFCFRKIVLHHLHAMLTFTCQN